MSIAESQATQSQATIADLERLSATGQRCELVAGELQTMAPSGFEHGWVTSELHRRLSQFVIANKLGWIIAAETGFVLARDPDTVRAPDVGLVSNEQIARIGVPRSYFPEAPILAVEVVSPSDRRREVADKVAWWLAAGAKQVWVVRPQERTVAVHATGRDAVVFAVDETLTGDVVPGFTCPVAELFPAP